VCFEAQLRMLMVGAGDDIEATERSLVRARQTTNGWSPRTRTSVAEEERV
jgi:hypothetical protein